MPMQLHMRIEGTKQKEIEGPCKIKGHEKTFEIKAFNHEVTHPFNAMNGKADGHRQHHPLTVLKEMDKGSPQFYKAIQGAEELTVEIEWYRTNPEGGAKPEHYFTTKLEGAILTSVSSVVANIAEQGGRAPHLEQLSFVYRKITWTFTGIGATIDDWEQPPE